MQSKLLISNGFYTHTCRERPLWRSVDRSGTSLSTCTERHRGRSLQYFADHNETGYAAFFPADSAAGDNCDSERAGEAAVQRPTAIIAARSHTVVPRPSSPMRPEMGRMK
jgi:hypothetical protein